MAEHEHASGLPEIHDEAADTPLWVPVVGITLLAAFVLLFTYQAATAGDSPEPPPVEAPAVEQGAAE